MKIANRASVNDCGGDAIVKDPFREAVRARLETVSSLDGHLTVPVDPEKIAEQFGLEVVRAPLENNVGGFILKKNVGAIRIYVNSNDSQEEQRFTLAHEIGHYWLHRDDDGEFGYVEYRDELSTRGTDPVERWANSFAAELIMPASYIRMAWARGDSLDSIQEMLGVSDAAFGHRLVNLGLIGR